jgi:hypothetical protein
MVVVCHPPLPNRAGSPPPPLPAPLPRPLPPAPETAPGGGTLMRLRLPVLPVEGVAEEAPAPAALR